MGTAESTIQKHFQEKNVYILLETLIAFLVSENVSHGYINNWDAWSNQCSKLKKEFKFSELYITPKNYSSGGVTSSIMNEIIERLNKEYVVNSHGMLEEVNKKEGL